nr:stalk domain-containing protein [uncultured Cellulosilyticum sp.]
MKLRQKLAVVLASAMVVTAVPVVTMAASTNSLVKETVKVPENTVTTANSLKINFKDNNGSANEVFYLKLTNAKWDADSVAQFAPKYAKDASGNAVSSYEIQNDSTVKVTVDKTVAKDASLTFPILAEVETGDAAVEVVSMGGSTTVSKGSFVFATTSEATVDVTVGTTIPTFYTTGEIADIVITESMTDAFKNLDGKNKIEIELDNSDYKFVDGTGEVTFEYGFSGKGNDAAKVALKADGDVLEVTLPADLKADGMGQIRISGLQVTTKEKAPETGDFTVSIYGDKTTTQTGVKVAEITSYGSEVTIDKADKVEIKAGQTKDVKFTLAETEKTSFVNGREVEFVLDKGYIMDQVETNDKYDEAKTIEAVKKAVTLTNTVAKKDLTITDVVIKDEKVVGFTAVMAATDSKDKIDVKMPIIAGLQESGDVTVAISGRAMAEEVKAVITTINDVFAVNSEAAVLKVGLQGQTAGKITVKEADKAMLATNKKIEITVPVESGITVTDAPEVKVTEGDIQIGDVTYKKSQDGKSVIVTVPVKRASKTASTIEIANFGFTVDRTVAEGKYDVTLGGDALTTTGQTLELDGFLTVGTPNTEDLGSNGLAKGTSTFVIGENKYTVNGVEKEMDARSYVQDPGFTMVPMRYVAEAFGVTGNNVLFSNGVTTIFAGNRTIQLTNNSDVAVVNGVQVKMATKVVIKEGRTYAPIGEVAQLLGVSKAWDNTTKTATFTNK